MIVAAGASDGEAKHRLRGGADDVIELVVCSIVACSLPCRWTSECSRGPGGHETGGDHRIRVVGLVFITCDLPPDEIVKWHVVVKCSDNKSR